MYHQHIQYIHTIKNCLNTLLVSIFSLQYRLNNLHTREVNLKSEPYPTSPPLPCHAHFPPTMHEYCNPLLALVWEKRHLFCAATMCKKKDALTSDILSLELLNISTIVHVTNIYASKCKFIQCILQFKRLSNNMNVVFIKPGPISGVSTKLLQGAPLVSCPSHPFPLATPFPTFIKVRTLSLESSRFYS